MNPIEYYEQIFEQQNYAQSGLPKAMYEACTFRECNFLEVDLTGFSFAECVFDGCDLSMAKIIDTAFKEVTFQNCKLLGVNFNVCNTSWFSASFSDCRMSMAVFQKMDLRGVQFENCDLRECDFSQADLSNGAFINCNLERAIFNYTNLEKCDLRAAYNYDLDPESNRIKKAKFSLNGLVGLLGKYDIDID